MSRRRPGRRRPALRRIDAAVVPFVAAAVLGTLLAVPAQAEPSLPQARAAASALADRVARLQVRTEMATEDYNTVNDALQRVVTRMVLAEQAVDAARAGASSAAGLADARVRALYMAGGSVALYASVLDAGDIGDVLDRIGNLDAAVGGDRSAGARARRVVADAGRARRDLGRLTAQRLVLQERAARAKARVDALLALTRQQLGAATATVRRLAEQDAARREALEAQQARTQLATLGALGDVPPGNPAAVAAINAARSQLGVPYVWGATGPDAFDCSGLTQWAYRQAGVALDRTSRQQWYDGARVALADLAPGDLLFWAYDARDATTIHHVALYVGAGRMIEAPRTGLSVREIPVYLEGFMGAVRPGPSASAPAGPSATTP